jgi:hypothetical protein
MVPSYGQNVVFVGFFEQATRAAIYPITLELRTNLANAIKQGVGSWKD